MQLGKITGTAYRRSMKKWMDSAGEVSPVLGSLGETAFVGDTEAVLFTSAHLVWEDEQALEIALTRLENTMSASGARVQAVAAQLWLPQETEEQALRDIVQTLKQCCQKRAWKLTGVQGTVSRGVSEILLELQAYGSRTFAPVQAVQPGMELVLTQYIALSGTAWLARRHETQLLQRYRGELIRAAQAFDEHLSVEAAAACMRQLCTSAACVLFPLGEGGIFAGLWEFGEQFHTGFTVDLKAIPILQETVEICEYLGINPYQLASDGGLLIAAADGGAVVEALAAAGIPAAVIGTLTDQKARVLTNQGETRFLDLPKADEIYTEIKEN